MICLSKGYISKHVSNCTLCTLEIYEASVGMVRDRILFPMAISSAAFQKFFSLLFSHQLNGDESTHLHLWIALMSTRQKVLYHKSTPVTTQLCKWQWLINSQAGKKGCSWQIHLVTKQRSAWTAQCTKMEPKLPGQLLNLLPRFLWQQAISFCQV